MEILVVAKVVPDADAAGFVPSTRTLRRDGVEMFVNPFDQRALRAGLDLRRPGERLTLVSMGPPAAEPALREAYALGADRVVLISDPALAGSDTLATARTLAAFLGRESAGLVLLGARSTDGETGQVPAEVAALTGWELVGPARRIERGADPARLLVDYDTDEGWERTRTEGPVLVTVGEKVAKLLKPTEEARAAAGSRVVERRSAGDLDLASDQVGTSGSPTRVVRVGTDTTRRAGVRFETGSVAERVDGALGWLADHPRPAPTTRRSTERPHHAPLASFVFVSGSDGGLDDRALPMLSEARRTFGGGGPFALAAGTRLDPEGLDRIRRAGAGELVHVGAGPSDLDPVLVAGTLRGWIRGTPQVEAGMFLSTGFGREVASRLAAGAGLGLTGDATALARAADGSITWSKPAFGSRAVADVVSRTRPSLATVRPGVFELERFPCGASDRVRVLDGPELPRRPEPLERHDESMEGFGDLDRAPIALSIGNGLGGPERLPALLRLVEGTGWAIGATRRIVDAGWVPRRLQVGLTGRSASPALAILLGVRGSPNHLIGWRRSGRILAVNPDPAAPVFSEADVGIVGAWEEVLPPLVERIRAAPGFTGTP